MAHDAFRDLPAVDRLLAHEQTQALLARFSRSYVLEHCRGILDELRSAIRRGDLVESEALKADTIVARLSERIGQACEVGLTRVVNATGTMLHTNLGRALLPQAALNAIYQAGSNAMNLEYDVVRGERGRREQLIED